MKHVDFTIVMTGSALFDLHALYTSKLLADSFPTLSREVSPAMIKIVGDLPDDKYTEWVGKVYGVGMMNLY